MLFFTIATLSLGSAVQGWDNTGVNVCPLQTMALVLKTDKCCDRGGQSVVPAGREPRGVLAMSPLTPQLQAFGIADNQWLVGVIGSALTISGLCFAWTADFFNNLLGRRGTIFLTGLFCIVSSCSH